MRALFIIIVALLTVAFSSSNVLAKTQYRPPASSIVVNADTGEILHAEQATKYIYPASLTKLMTLYLTFQALEAKRISINENLLVSHNAAKMPASRLGLRKGETIKTSDAILALIIKSANDAAVVLAERLAGSEKSFSHKMNHQARKLGMNNTFFTNASGWHHRQQKSTAVDMAKLAIALERDFPKYYSLFAKTSFQFRGKTIKGHNHLTANYPGAEGLKTGYTSASGYNIITAAKREGKRLIAVVTGSSSSKKRDRTILQLLNKHFDEKADTTLVSQEIKTRKIKKKYKKKK